MYIIYQIFYIIFFLFYIASLPFKKRRREAIAMRLGIYQNELKDRLSKRNNIWIHAVSVGEVMVAKVLADRIRDPSACRPQDVPSLIGKNAPRGHLSRYNIVISTITETGNSVAKKIIGKQADVIYLPLDITFAIERAIQLIKPAIFIMIETEIWPNLIRRLYKNRVPILFSNGRISSKSYKWYTLIRPILKNILDCITAFLMRTEEDADRIISLGASASKVVIAGNMKFDNVDFYIDEEQRQKNLKALGIENRKLIVAGSTHPGEEDILLKVYSKLIKKYDDLSFLIAPRHIERAEDVARLVKSYGFTPVRISQLAIDYRLSTINSPIYILDTMGQLKLFYSLAWLVFVGGSLIKHGGQNMIEPACFGKPILFGPHTFNFKDVASLFLSRRGALLVKDEISLTEAIEMLYKDEGLAKNMGKHAKKVVTDNQGASAKTLDAIKTILHF